LGAEILYHRPPQFVKTNFMKNEKKFFILKFKIIIDFYSDSDIIIIVRGGGSYSKDNKKIKKSLDKTSLI